MHKLKASVATTDPELTLIFLKIMVYCLLHLYSFAIAGVAQLVEQRIRNAQVGGSIPLSGTRDSKVIFAYGNVRETWRGRRKKF